MPATAPTKNKLVRDLEDCAEELALAIKQCERWKPLYIRCRRAICKAAKVFVLRGGYDLVPVAPIAAQFWKPEASDEHALRFFYQILAPWVRTHYRDRLLADAGIYDFPDEEKIKHYDEAAAFEHMRARFTDALDVLRVLAELAEAPAPADGDKKRADSKNRKNKAAKLTPRQKRLADYMDKGYSDETIMAEMGIKASALCRLKQRLAAKLVQLEPPKSRSVNLRKANPLDERET